MLRSQIRANFGRVIFLVISIQMDGIGKYEFKPHTSPTHTREQVVKMSGVGTGTVAIPENFAHICPVLNFLYFND